MGLVCNFMLFNFCNNVVVAVVDDRCVLTASNGFLVSL